MELKLPGRMAANKKNGFLSALLLVFALILAFAVARPSAARASTYVVYIPMDSSIYNELEELNGLGYLDTYMDEILPIARIEAARLTLEAAHNLNESGKSDALATALINTLRLQLKEEIGWLENNAEDNQPTMIHPLERVEVQYAYSAGPRRYWETGPGALLPAGPAGINAKEATPLWPNNDDLPTGAGSNEIVRASGWTGFGGFLTGYAEGAASGPFTRSLAGENRFNLLDGEIVASLGNFALSFGQEEAWWSVGYFGALPISTNIPPLPAVRLQNIHPLYLPWIFRYLGPFRFQFFFGQLSPQPYPYVSRPWYDGEIFSFKPLPYLEFGIFHQIDFGGRFNNDYTASGFLERAFGIPGVHPVGANSHSRAGLWVKFYLPFLRNAELYQGTLAEDKLLGFLPFVRVSYQGGIYIPRLTEDGLTDLRFEYAILEPAYSIYSSGLALVYQDTLIGYPLGPNASEIDFQIGRWIDLMYKINVDFFFTTQAPGYTKHQWYPLEFYPYGITDEYSGGVAIDLWRMAQGIRMLGGTLETLRIRTAFEYARNLNYAPNTTSFRGLLVLSGSFRPISDSFAWR
jgi:hypothetical protein